MANFAKVVIEIVAEPGASFHIDADGIDIHEGAVIQRSGPNEFTTSESELLQVVNLSNALGLDYKEPDGLVASLPIIVQSILEISPDLFGVSIEFTEYGHSFTENITPGWVDITITPENPPPPELEITTITVDEANGVNKCGTVKYNFQIENDVPSDFPIQITSPVSKTCPTANDLFFDYDRFPVPAVTLSIESAISNTDSTQLGTVTTWDFGNDDIIVEESISGATVIGTERLINIGFFTSLDIKYSLNGIDYQSGNVFYGLTPVVDAIFYVKDRFGCIKTGTFTVQGITIDKPDPIFNIVNNNSFKFFRKKAEEFDGKSLDGFPNFDNSQLNQQLYFNTEKTCYYQPVQHNDSPVSQILTNYETVTAELKELSTDEIVATLSPTEVVTNILQKDKRDCKIIGGESGKTIIYFTGGNIYEPDTTIVITTYSNPNLLLPSFLDSETINSGITVILSDNAVLNGTFKVEFAVSIELSDGSIARGLQINAVYTGSSNGTAVIGQGIYNALDYNVWEFTTAFEFIDDGYYYLDINATDVDPRYDDVQWLSEPIHLESNVWQKTTYIEWLNSENFEGSDFSTGIKHMLRIPARFVKYRNGGEKETFEDSQGRVEPLFEVIVRDITIETALIPQYIVEKLNLIIGHDNVTINGLKGTFVDKSEDEDIFEEQNRNYNSTAVFRLSESTTIGRSSVISEAGEILGVGSGTFVLSIKY